MPSTSTMPITPDAPTLSRPARSPAPRSVPPAAESTGGASSVAVLELVDRAREALLEACHSNGTTERYALAQLGALRAATALVANRISTRRRSARRDVWTTLVAGVPELTEWAEFFALTSARGASAERGRAHLTAREADDLVRQAEMFLELVLSRLGLPMYTPLPGYVSPLRRP
ncbi:SAV_6107 family HEPN domain-containing protein [Allobranchiibius sp. GilTou38]|uniref:SAV_6107 family HEPN domain-containing protein n=1 Tax=Allobranchiibius sp. GilTou38 TaxID=2815210 RepID=UPI001FB5E17A|nr:SAV_6107 family HEPN domain-containing protein [Allobranchiibius sp. GilTou38]